MGTARYIKSFIDESSVFFDRGKFDDWCVYYKESNKKAYAPSDIQYFDILLALAQKYGSKRVYNDFIKLYKATNHQVRTEVLLLVKKLSELYGVDKLTFEKCFVILYAGMVAEENKTNAILKKRIKRLGVHQVLIDSMPVEKAAVFSRHKKWQELDKICSEKGF